MLQINKRLSGLPISVNILPVSKNISCWENNSVSGFVLAVTSEQFVLFVPLYSTNVHRCANIPVCTNTAVTLLVVKITKPLTHLIQQRKKAEKNNKTSDLSFLRLQGQGPSYAERIIEKSSTSSSLFSKCNILINAFVSV